MKTILEELFNGNLEPYAKFFEKNSEYGQIMKIISHNEEKLLSALQGDEKVMFKSFSNAQGNLNSITSRDSFVSGFKLGALIMMEVLTSKNEFIFESETENGKEQTP